MNAARALPFLVLGVLGIAGLFVGRALVAPQPAPAPAPVPAEPTPTPPVPAPQVPDEPAEPDGPRTVIDDPDTAARLVGRHPLSLQWVGWGKYGEVEFKDDHGLLRLSGRQDAKRGTDFVSMGGVVTRVGTKRFTFVGVIETRVSHIADGKTCRREGTFHFRATGKRRYFRLKEKVNPCDGSPRLVDYVDIFWTHKL